MRPFSSSSEWMEEGFGPWKGLTLWKGWLSVGRAGAPFLEPISAGDAKFKAVVGEKEEKEEEEGELLLITSLDLSNSDTIWRISK